MSDNRALLSQEEIDALVSFLKTKEKIGNEVLDQASIDRLVEILTEAKANEGTAAGVGRFYGNAVLSMEKDMLGVYLSGHPLRPGCAVSCSREGRKGLRSYRVRELCDRYEV